MKNKDKLKRMLGGLNTFDDEIAGIFKSLDTEMQNVSKTLKETITAKTLNQVTQEFKKLEGRFKPLLSSFEELKGEIKKRDEEASRTLRETLGSLSSEWDSVRGKDLARMSELSTQISVVKEALRELSSREMPDFTPQIREVEVSLRKLIDLKTNGDLEIGISVLREEMNKDIKEMGERMSKMRMELLSYSQRGGNANRNISVGGNLNTLSRYTDVNLKAGSNVTITYANNDTLKTTDVTFASTGGPGGTVRSINSISTSQTAGSTAGTDYVYIASAGVALTLPTAVGNENLYTIKNTSASSVLVATTGGQTIDTSANLILATQYTSVDLISDSANWNIT